MNKEKEIKALVAKLNGRTPYRGNSGRMRVSGCFTITDSEFTVRERKVLRSLVPINNCAFQATMKSKLGW